MASIVAKQILSGQHVVLVRCEEMNISGSLFRNQVKFHRFLRKRMLTNPQKGPIHYRSPSRIFWRTVRGMVPHKTTRGVEALARMKVFDGVPHPYDKVKKMVVPEALRNLRLRPGRKFCRLGDLAAKCGWTYGEVVADLERARKVRGNAYYAKKKQVARLTTIANKKPSEALQKINEQLAEFGY
jgi:large subunit ribosomal protein L13Ae